MELLMLGTNHRDADLAVRESLAFSPEEAMELVREVAADAAVHEAAALCTCNRTELYAVVEDGTTVFQAGYGSADLALSADAQDWFRKLMHGEWKAPSQAELDQMEGRTPARAARCTMQLNSVSANAFSSAE